MGSRILSRSFHVEKWEGKCEKHDNDQALAAVEDTRNMMEIDLAEQDTMATEDYEQHNVEDGQKTDEEDNEDPSDIAMVPFADILNARYRSENVRLLAFCRQG